MNWRFTAGLIVLLGASLLFTPTAIAPDGDAGGSGCSITYVGASSGIVGERASPNPGFSITCPQNVHVAYRIGYWRPDERPGAPWRACGGIGGFRGDFVQANQPFSYGCSELHDHPGRWSYRIEVGISPWSVTDAQNNAVSHYRDVNVACPTCSSEQIQCGSYSTGLTWDDNNCDDTLNCGTCPSGESCENNVCVDDPEPTQCEEEGQECGGASWAANDLWCAQGDNPTPSGTYQGHCCPPGEYWAGDLCRPYDQCYDPPDGPCPHSTDVTSSEWRDNENCHTLQESCCSIVGGAFGLPSFYDYQDNEVHYTDAENYIIDEVQICGRAIACGRDDGICPEDYDQATCNRCDPDCQDVHEECANEIRGGSVCDDSCQPLEGDEPIDGECGVDLGQCDTGDPGSLSVCSGGLQTWICAGINDGQDSGACSASCGSTDNGDNGDSCTVGASCNDAHIFGGFACRYDHVYDEDCDCVYSSEACPSRRTIVDVCHYSRSCDDGTGCTHSNQCTLQAGESCSSQGCVETPICGSADESCDIGEPIGASCDLSGTTTWSCTNQGASVVCTGSACTTTGTPGVCGSSAGSCTQGNPGTVSACINNEVTWTCFGVDGGANSPLCTDECEECTPTTCAAAGAQCGSIPDDCGGTLSCGGCGTGSCSGNQCVCTVQSLDPQRVGNVCQYNRVRQTSCSITQSTEFCPSSGTIVDGTCYYGPSTCTNSGCNPAPNSCTLSGSQSCHAQQGCVFVDLQASTTSGTLPLDVQFDISIESHDSTYQFLLETGEVTLGPFMGGTTHALQLTYRYQTPGPHTARVRFNNFGVNTYSNTLSMTPTCASAGSSVDQASNCCMNTCFNELSGGGGTCIANNVCAQTAPGSLSGLICNTNTRGDMFASGMVDRDVSSIYEGQPSSTCPAGVWIETGRCLDEFGEFSTRCDTTGTSTLNPQNFLTGGWMCGDDPNERYTVFTADDVTIPVCAWTTPPTDCVGTRPQNNAEFGPRGYHGTHFPTSWTEVETQRDLVACEFRCWTDHSLDPVSRDCVPDTDTTCTGSLPSENFEQGRASFSDPSHSPTEWTEVDDRDRDLAACEFRCEDDHMLQGGQCVPRGGQCADPQPTNAILGNTDYLHGYTPTTWTHTDNPGDLLPCEFRCESGHAHDSTTNSCVPEEWRGECVGSVPSEAESGRDHYFGPPSPRNWEHTTASGPLADCEFRCPEGSGFDGTQCVPGQVACDGARPSEDVTVGLGSYTPPYSPTSWVEVTEDRGLSPCEFRCDSGFRYSSDTDRCEPDLPFECLRGALPAETTLYDLGDGRYSDAAHTPSEWTFATHDNALQACEFRCRQGLSLVDGQCIPDEGVCIGERPTHHVQSGPSYYEAEHTPIEWTFVSDTVRDLDACEFRCSDNFAFNGTHCTDNVNTCSGNLPEENVISGPSEYTVPYDITTWVSITEDRDPQACEFRCADGFRYVSGTNQCEEDREFTCQTESLPSDRTTLELGDGTFSDASYQPQTFTFVEDPDRELLACEFRCADERNWDGGRCVSGRTSCGGLYPEHNVTTGLGSFTGSHTPVNWTFVSHTDNLAPCEFRCDSGTVHDPISNQCVRPEDYLCGVGQLSPQESNARLGPPGYSDPLHTPVNWTFVTHSLDLRACEFRCREGHAFVNGLCRRTTPPPPPDTEPSCDGDGAFYDPACDGRASGTVTLVLSSGLQEQPYPGTRVRASMTNPQGEEYTRTERLAENGQNWSMRVPKGTVEFVATFAEQVGLPQTHFFEPTQIIRNIDLEIYQRVCQDNCANQFGICDRGCLGLMNCPEWQELSEGAQQLFDACAPDSGAAGRPAGSIMQVDRRDGERLVGTCCVAEPQWVTAPAATVEAEVNNLIQVTRLVIVDGMPMRLTAASWN